MVDLAENVELVRLTLVIGVIVGMLIYQRTHLTLGGVIIPGYFALFITHPTHIIVTLFIAAATYYILHRIVLPRKMIWGRQLMEAEILIAILLQTLWTWLMYLTGQFTSASSLFIGAGIVLSGVIAHDMTRQKGVSRTIIFSLVGAIVVYLIIFMIQSIEEILPRWDFMALPLSHAPVQPYAFPVNWLPLAVLASLLLGFFILKRFNIHTVGFAATAYIALIAVRPMDIGLLLLCAFLTYGIVVFVIQRIGLVYGRAKLGVMILVGTFVAWGAELLLTYLSHGTIVVWGGVAGVIPLMVALIANDFERQGIPKASFATLITIGFILIVTQVAQGFLLLIRPV